MIVNSYELLHLFRLSSSLSGYCMDGDEIQKYTRIAANTQRS